MIFRTIVDSLFWAFVLQIFFFTLDLLSAGNFKPETYTVFGFLLIWFYAFIIIYILRELAKDNNKKS